MPPKKNKKPGRNGFFQFMLHVKDEKGIPLNEAQEVANEIWKQMSMEEREPWKTRAIQHRNHYETKQKYNTIGQPIDAFQKAHEEKVENERLMKEEINNELKFLMKANAISTTPFLVIHINKLVHSQTENRYYVCEIAVAAFTLEGGVKPQNVFHRLIYPGNLPLGYYGEAANISRLTHTLLEHVADKKENTEEVFKDLIEFLNLYCTNGQPITLYCHEKSMFMTKDVIDMWCDFYDFPKKINVYSLEYFFFTLKNTVSNNTWPRDTLAYIEIDKDIYSHVANISCEIHELADVTVYCSKSIVTRFCYCICDICCHDLGIQLEPGLHVPEGSSVVVLENSRPASRASVTSSASSCNIRPTSNSSLESSSFVVTDSDSDFPSLGSKSRSSYKSARATVASGYRDHASVESGESTNTKPDLKKIQEKLKHLNVSKRGAGRQE